MAVCARARAAPRCATGARKAPRRAREGPQAAAADAGAGTGAAAAAHGVPTVDVSALAEGADAGARARCVAELRDACATVGFFYAVGHGIAHERSRETLAVAARFFALPAETKRALDYRHSYAFRGYISRGAENTAGVVDEREQVEIGDEAPAHADPTCVRPYYERLRGPNQWPAEEDCPGFRTELEAFAADMQALSMRLTGALAESLGLPATHFDPLFDEPHTQLKVCHYPALEAADANASGVGAHSDSGFLSLLLQDDAGGLQVQLASGEWIDAPPVEGSFVVNLGEMMQLASGGRLRATVHRVVRAPRRARLSVPCVAPCCAPIGAAARRCVLPAQPYSPTRHAPCAPSPPSHACPVAPASSDAQRTRAPPARSFPPRRAPAGTFSIRGSTRAWPSSLSSPVAARTAAQTRPPRMGGATS